MSKEYKDRQHKPVVNPGETLHEYEKNKIKDRFYCVGCGCYLDVVGKEECFDCYRENFRRGYE